MLRFLPLGAATHLSYELDLTDSEYSFQDELKYWQKRALRGEVREVCLAGYETRRQGKKYYELVPPYRHRVTTDSYEQQRND